MNAERPDLDNPRTLVEALRRTTSGPFASSGFRFLADGECEGEGAFLTFRDLDRRAGALATILRNVADEADRVVLLMPPGPEFLVALFGVLEAGLVAVPAYPPRNGRPDARLRAIVENSGARVAIAGGPTLANRDRHLASLPELACLRWIDPAAASEMEDHPRPAIEADPDRLAILQYTSGSTGDPRGVMLSHRVLLANLRGMRERIGLEPGDKAVCWLPHFHDMGLIGNLLQTVVTGMELIWMPPAAFVQRPIRWLRAISRHRAVVSGGPNSAFDLCARKIDLSECAGLDLSSWRTAFAGSEPIAAGTLDRFVAAFGPFGFRRETFYPCYGLAEATLMVTGGSSPAAPVLRSVLREPLERGRAIPSGFAEGEARTLVGSGPAVPETEIRIVDPEALHPVEPGRIGEIWVAGPGVGLGYWDRPEETERTFRGRLDGDGRTFLRTGDLGVLDGEELFVTGRLKDVLIFRGRNVYPQDIESAVEGVHPALKSGCGAAVAVEDESGGDARLVFLQEVERTGRHAGLGPAVEAIRRVVTERFELEVSAVVLVRPATIARTSSGKIQRRECLRKFLAGELEEIHRWESSAAPANGHHATNGHHLTNGHGPTARNGHPVAKPGMAEVRDWLIARIASHLGIPADRVEVGRPFAAFGLDSMTMVALSAELETWLGRPLSPTLLYDAPTIDRLAESVTEPGPNASAGRPEAPVREPIAVIGIGCRFPGADSPEAFWQLLAEGRDAVGTLPEGRWEAVPEGIATRSGGFLDRVDGFDPQFFGIAPNEAASIDPQHRLLLEVAWEALEDAGIAADRLAGAPVGVFVGIANSDYGRMILRGPGVADAYIGTGNSAGMAANRLSYTFDFRGPSASIDTACSSSLVAVHQACQSLRDGGCEVALAAGVNLMLAPEVSQALSNARMLSPTGRCRTFDASADGYVRGEGCGLVVLKPLSAAIRDGDRVYALIRGGAVNQDGRSNGITAPNGASQTDLIRSALRDAGASADQIGCVEAHGTGTILGDPIEFGAIRAALGTGTRPCAVGTVKTNLGHLEAAAGIAGLIKAVLQLQRREIAPHLHLKDLNPHIPLGGSRFYVPSGRHAWPAGSTTRLAGVSSFGFGGTNAHIILEEAGPLAVDPGASSDRPAHLLSLSAPTESALRTLAGRFAGHLASNPAVELADLCRTANAGRSRFPSRLAVVGGSAEEIGRSLSAYAERGEADGLRVGRADRDLRGRLAFLFTGQGSSYVGMGRQLYRTCPTFRDALDRCDAASRAHLDRSLVEVLYPAEGHSSPIDDALYAQPALFAFEYALAETWQSWGIVPDAVMGHSLGEYAAACVAGVFGLEEGIGLVATRARLAHELDEPGAMAVVFAPTELVADRIEGHRDAVGIAAINGPKQVTISGRAASVATICARLQREGIGTRTLPVARAYHSPMLDAMLGPLEEAASRVAFAAPRIRLVSNLSGRVANGEIRSPTYWRRQARDAVRFADGVRTLHAEGLDLFVEIGPSPTLLALGQGCLPPGEGTWIPSLRKGRDDWRVMLEGLAELAARGASIDWAGVDGGANRRRLALPTYPFERTRCWFETPSRSAPETLLTPIGPRRLAESLRPEVARLVEEVGLRHHEPLRDEFDRLAARYATNALRDLGWRPRPGDPVEVNTLVDRLGIAPKQVRLFGRLLAILTEEGVLNRLGADWRVVRLPEAEETASASADLIARFPACEAELTLAGRCAEQLGAVLRGDRDPLGVLFPGGSTELVERIYRDSPFARLANGIAAEAIGRAVRRAGAGRIVRILELGAGTGGTTADLLPKLPADRVEYAFTDVSPLFAAQAEGRFRDVSFLKAGVLDIERDPEEQGFAPHAFDVILAANVLHATAGLRRSIRHARKLLAPGGLLAILEGTGPRRLLDLIFGLTDGWWRFEDRDIRPDYPLIAPRAWTDLLAGEGFDEPTALPNSLDGLVDPDQVVILARGPSVVVAPAPCRGQAGRLKSDFVSRRNPPPQPSPTRGEGVRTLDLAEIDTPSPLVGEGWGGGSLGTEGSLCNRPGCQARPLTPRLIDVPATTEGTAADGPTPDTLRAASPSERAAILVIFLREQLGRVLGLDPARIDPDRPVHIFGLDSLMAIQLKNRVEARLEVSLPIVLFLEGSSLAQIAARIESSLSGLDAAPDPDPETAPTDLGELIDRLDDLSEADLDAILVNLIDET